MSMKSGSYFCHDDVVALIFAVMNKNRRKVKLAISALVPQIQWKKYGAS